MDWIVPVLAFAALSLVLWVVRKNKRWDSESEQKKSERYLSNYHRRPRQ